jgi:hypothetical protein
MFGYSAYANVVLQITAFVAVEPELLIIARIEWTMATAPPPDHSNLRLCRLCHRRNCDRGNVLHVLCGDYRHDVLKMMTVLPKPADSDVCPPLVKRELSWCVREAFRDSRSRWIKAKIGPSSAEYCGTRSCTCEQES